MGSSSSYFSPYPSLLLWLFSTIINFPCFIISGPVSYISIEPNFTASYLQFVDNSASGAFLASQNRLFQARIINTNPESEAYYLVVTHVSSNTIIWSANRNSPISKSSKLKFTNKGLVLYNDTNNTIWSTPQNLPLISSLQLLNSGNLVLIDSGNNTVWESFDYPIDLMVAGQKLKIGKSLVSSVSDEDLSEGSYKLVLGDNDAMLQWNEMNYWKLSMGENVNINTNFPVEYMVMNFTGVFLMGQSGEQVVSRVTLRNISPNSSDFHVMKIDHNGVLSVVKIEGEGGDESSNHREFYGPVDICQVPFICKKLGVCYNGGNCQCASAFHADQKTNNGDCVPDDTSLAFSSGSCSIGSLISNGTRKKKIKYLDLRNDLDYFSNGFTEPLIRGVNLSTCENICSRNCSCLGIFHSENSGTCYMIRNFLGSMFIKSSSQRDPNRLGYLKMLVEGDEANYKKSNIPILPLVLLPSSGVVLFALIAVMVYLMRKRSGKRKSKKTLKLGNFDNSSFSDDEEIEFVSIPGLPVRFEYDELASATELFKNQIGSGGFGIVYKGTLKDGTDVAVKKITCLGSQGKKEFLTEIAVIGKIHHINLVRLKGFCAYKGQRFLVYEFMSRGSLEKNLFPDDSVLEWNERYEVAVQTAKGLAYLHTGCEHKIIHCDVKPENILLHEKSQVKMSDFGLSKLLSPEQSGLFTTLRGTRGYLAPEWLTSSVISDKIDVYSYGMVLLEIIRGKKNSSPQSYSSTSRSNSLSTSGESEHNRLVYYPLFALEMHEDRRYLELLDPRLMGRARVEDVEKLVRVALCCVHEDPNLRPSMNNVIGILEGGMPLCEPRIESLHFLRFYGRRFTEESTLGENDEQQNHELMMYRQRQQQASTNTSANNSFSYLSSHQVSGPR